MTKRIDNVLEWLEQSAISYPEKTVFADEHTRVTYRAFVQNAKRLALAVAERTPPRTLVAVLGNKTVDTLTAFFACVYAGCFYVPLNPAHPSARKNRILETLGDPLVLVCDGQDVTGLRAQSILHTSDAKKSDAFATLDAVRGEHIDTDPLYVLFTSGSTGEPKGIAVSHRSVIDFIEVFVDVFAIGENEVLANQAPFDFDVSVKDIYATVKAGATLEIIPKQKFSFPVMLVDYLCSRRATTLIWAVSAMCILSGLNAFSYKVPPTVQKVLFSGEAMPPKHLAYWKKYYPAATFVNLYGPTEITCNCAYYVLPDGPFTGATLPIGRPFPNERILLLDDDGRTVTKVGVQGEICVVDTALSLGYYNRPTETAAAFVQNPLVTAYGQTMYKTGDIGYYGDDGLLYFVGRRDFQIKYMGHRIELSEIERAMTSLSDVTRAVCVFDRDKQKIYAFYQGTADAKDITTALHGALPAFMVPHRFERVETFPLTENGKVDRKALSAAYRGGNGA